MNDATVKTLTVKEIANELRVSMPTAYALCRRPGFPAARIGGQIRIPRRAFREWIDRQTEGEGKNRDG